MGFLNGVTVVECSLNIVFPCVLKNTLLIYIYIVALKRSPGAGQPLDLDFCVPKHREVALFSPTVSEVKHGKFCRFRNTNAPIF